MSGSVAPCDTDESRMSKNGKPGGTLLNESLTTTPFSLFDLVARASLNHRALR